MHRTRSPRGEQDAVAKAWAERSPELARWALSHLVVRVDAYGGHRADGSRWTVKEEPSFDRLVRHFAAIDASDVIGLHVSSTEETCRTTWADIDAHDGHDADPAANFRYGVRVWKRAARSGFNTRLLDSNGKGGYHVPIVHAKPISLAASHRLGKYLVRDHAAYGFATPPETFPKRPVLTGKRFGGWVRLPGRHHKRDHWTRVWSQRRRCWLTGHDAIDSLLHLVGFETDPDEVIPSDYRPAATRSRTRTIVELDVGPRLTGWRHEQTVRRARSALGHLGAEYRDDYHGWLRIGMALRELGPDGLEIWEEWSRPSPRYEAGATAAKWSSFAPGPATQGVTLGTLFAMAKQAGWDGLDEETDPHTGVTVKTNQSGSHIKIIIAM